MKKYLLLVVLFSFILFGCQKNDISNIDVSTIVDLPTLQRVITQVSQEMNERTMSMEQAQKLVNQLQQRYVDLMDNPDKNIETTFATIQKTFDEQSITLYGLPLWAKKLGMIEPKGMELNTTVSKQHHINDTGYDSTVLVYKGNYIIALQQAKLIAQRAHLYVSKNFQQAQSLAKIGNVDYISGLDIGGLSKGIVYVNHELLDTNIDQMLSVSVDQEGTLTIEATNYKN